MKWPYKAMEPHAHPSHVQLLTSALYQQTPLSPRCPPSAEMPIKRCKSVLHDPSMQQTPLLQVLPLLFQSEQCVVLGDVLPPQPWLPCCAGDQRLQGGTHAHAPVAHYATAEHLSRRVASWHELLTNSRTANSPSSPHTLTNQAPGWIVMSSKHQLLHPMAASLTA